MKYYKIIPIVTILFLVFGCSKEDLLITIPDDRISTEIFWETDKDATLAANAVYTYLENVNTFFMWDGISDLGHVNVLQQAAGYIELGLHSSNDAPILEQWSRNYKGIRAANVFLDNVDNVDASDPDLIERLKGEVRFLRSFFYYRLASLYGDVPLITNTISLEDSRKLTRTPVNEVWEFIVQELTIAAEQLPNSQTEIGRVTKGAAISLKAKALLVSGKFSDAAIAAKEVIDLDIYSLYPSYKNLFSYAAENNHEVIFDIQYLQNSHNNDVFRRMAPYSQNNANNAYVPTKVLVDEYEMNNGMKISDDLSGFDPYDPYKDRDPRLKYSIFVPDDTLPKGNIYDPLPGSGTTDEIGSTWNATVTGFNLRKYINNEDLIDFANCGINIIIIRYAEILLTYAEAKIEANDIDQSVLDAINEIRQRPDVDMPPITTIGTQVEMREIVRHERTVELAFEGLRYFDIIRWETAEEVMSGPVYGLTYEAGDNSLITVEVPASTRVFDKDRHYLWPIPQTEKELNPALEQNPGW